MAGSKITALTEDTEPVSTDLIATVDDPAGSPVNKKVQLANLNTRTFTFTNGDIASDGTLTVAHTLNARDLFVYICNSSGVEVKPKSVNGNSTTQVVIDMSGTVIANTADGTWRGRLSL